MKTKFSHLVGAVFKRRWWVGLLAAGLAITLVAIARATIPDASGAIHACYRKNGALRLVDGAACKSTEKALVWNQKGPRGIPGPQGAPGPQGQRGPAGPAGVSGWEKVQGDRMLPPNISVTVIATCPTGKFVFGGGYSTYGALGITAQTSKPQGNNAWLVEFSYSGGGGSPVPVTAYAICARAS
jgi:hypothetical protein